MSEAMKISEETLAAFFDGELSDAEAREMAGLVEGDPAAQALLDDWAAQKAALSALYAPGGEEPLPGDLRARLDAARAPSAPVFTRIAAAVALVALGVAGGWGGAVMTAAGRSAPGPDVAESAYTAHLTYVAEVAHPVEVEASQAAHLTGWVSKRLGHDISPPDFATLGFRLMGGRVLPGETGPAAQFMYENEAGKRVTLYVATPDETGETSFQFAAHDGAMSFYWRDNGLSYAVIGAIPRAALRAVAVAAYEQLI